MPIILQVTSGPSEGQKIQLQSGQLVQIGRSARSDFSFPQDAAMSDTHLALECNYQGCRLTDLDSRAGTLLNGQKVVDAVLRDGDQITAGHTTFHVRIQPAAAGSSAGQARTGQSKSTPQTAAEFCKEQELELAEAAAALLDDKQSPIEFVDVLTEEALFADAVRVLAHLLPKREAVWWASRCVRDSCGDGLAADQAAALDAAERWVAEPNETNRRAAESAAEAAGNEGSASMVALAAFWGGGSLAPPDLPEVTPDARLTGKGIVGALMLAAHADPQHAADNFRTFLDKGREIMDGKTDLPEG